MQSHPFDHYQDINLAQSDGSPYTRPLNTDTNSPHQDSYFSPVQLQRRIKYHKAQAQNKHHNLSSQEQDQVGFINSNSIVKRYQLLLITCLIMSSIASVKFSTSGSFSHIKNVRNYFNSQLLGNDNPTLYEEGDNIDESELELSLLSDIDKHFNNVVEVVNNFTQFDGFTQFTNQVDKNVEVQILYIEAASYKEQISVDDFQIFLFRLDKRDFILALREMRYTISFGYNKKVKDLNLTVIYTTSASLTLNLQLQFQYEPNLNSLVNSNDRAIRIVEQLLAFLLLCSYLHNVYRIQIQIMRLKQISMFYPDVKTLQKNRAYWCYSLAFLNIVTIISQTLAPLASFLQLLPIFQRHDSANLNKYNFNTNLRYAIPLVMRIFIPVVIFLNGFIFYSMLMYPGDYFQSYTLGFFSYVYQNFQVGTYEIFTELKGRGDFAYFLYGILYFYMVLVGNNLFPALFCTMIYIKMYEKDLKNYIQRTIKTAVCPKCNSCNFNDGESNNFQININSPRISPYLRGKFSTALEKKPQLSLTNKMTKMFVEEQGMKNKDVHMLYKRKIDRIKSLSQKLNKITDPQHNRIRQTDQNVQKIQRLIRTIKFSLLQGQTGLFPKEQ